MDVAPSDASTEPRENFRVYSTRWYILGTFSCVSFIQCAMWLTYSPIACEAKVYYGMCNSTGLPGECGSSTAECAIDPGPGQAEIDLLLNWGPIT